MSTRLIIAVIRGAFGLTPAQKLVLIALAEFARQDTCLAWPSVATLAHFCCLLRRQIQTILRSLAATGWIEVVRASRGGRPNNEGRRLTTVYRINVAKLAEAHSNNCAAECAVSADENCAVDRAVLTRNRAVTPNKLRGIRQRTAHSSAHKPVIDPVITSTGGRPHELLQSVSQIGKSKPIDRVNGEKPAGDSLTGAEIPENVRRIERLAETLGKSKTVASA